MTQLVQTIVAGLGQGAIYALVALGFVIIYKSTLVVSFAQPALMVAGATFVVLTHELFTSLVGAAWLGFAIAVLVAMAGTGAIGLGLERVALRPMVGKPVFVVAIITIGLDIAIRVPVNRLLGNDIRSVGDPWGLSVWRPAGILVQHRHVAMIVALAIVVALLYCFFKFTRFGLAMRATAFDQETALAQGINVGRVFSLSWAIAGALAALAGVFVGSGSSITHTTWIIALKALPAIIIGGLDSVGGAVIGGLAVGVVETLVGTYQQRTFEILGFDLSLSFLGNNFAIVSPYLLLLLVLLVRPYGLFGTHEVERV